MGEATGALSLYEGLLATAGANGRLVLARLGRTCLLLANGPPRRRHRILPKGAGLRRDPDPEEPNRVEGAHWPADEPVRPGRRGGKLLGRRAPARILEELDVTVALDAAHDQAGARRVVAHPPQAPGWPLSVGASRSRDTSRRRSARPRPPAPTISPGPNPVPPQ